MSASNDSNNLQDLEDFSSEDSSPTQEHDQLPSVEEVKMTVGGTVRSSSKKTQTMLWSSIVTFLLLVMIITISVVKNNNNKVIDISKALNTIALHGSNDFQNSTNYQFYAKRWLVEDEMVERYSMEQLQQRYAMYCLHHATGPNQWIESSGWKRKGVPECDWYGVTCAKGTNQVTRIELRNNGLRGEVPEEISLMPHLKVFNVNANDDLKGMIPNQVCNVAMDNDWTVKVDCDTVECDCCTNCEVQN